MKGAVSWATVTRHSHRVRTAALVSASSPDLQKRLRERRTYQFDRSSTNASSRRPPVVASSASSDLVTHVHRVGELGQDPAVEHGSVLNGDRVCAGIEPFERCVRHPERIGVPQRHQVLAHHVFDYLG